MAVEAHTTPKPRVEAAHVFIPFEPHQSVSEKLERVAQAMQMVETTVRPISPAIREAAIDGVLSVAVELLSEETDGADLLDAIEQFLSDRGRF